MSVQVMTLEPEALPRWKPEDPLAYLEAILQARLQSWEGFLQDWEALPMRCLNLEVIGDRKGRVDELKEVLRFIKELQE